MSVDTKSIFYYFNEDISTTNQNINFIEGVGPELTAVITIGSFTHTELATEIKTSLDATGALTYTVTFDRTTRKYTISTTSAFDLLISSGSQVGTSPFTLMGFTGADLTGLTTYTGDSVAGEAFEPQFILQDFVDEDDNRSKIDAQVNESSNGIIEVVSFGQRRIYEMNIRYSTDRDVGETSPINNNSAGVADVRQFMQRIIDKVPFEFMKNIGARSTFDKVILESSPESSQGTAYRLKELSLRGGPTGFFDTGLLRMRVL